MNNTQRRIVETLQGAMSASTVELAGTLGMTVANVRHHLAILKENLTVEMVERRSSPGRGRPTYLYRLRPQALQNNLDALCQALLDECLADLSEPERLQFIQRVATRLVSSQTPGANASRVIAPRDSHLGLRLTQAVQVLNQMHYQARWEAHTRGPRVFFNACPYLAILPEYPELCRLDSQLLAALAGLPAYQAARIDPSRYCLFYIGKTPPPSPLPN
jgi:predicted ArsR family transcriptional regulator